MLQDIAILTGADVISEETGLKLETATIEDLGRAEKVTSDKENTTIVGGKGDPMAIKGRIEQIRVEIENTTGTSMQSLITARPTYTFIVVFLYR